ncbi:hypothetical protein L1049_024897 [Liquidambar formosana]|uniref:Uncharacterized protein n=1 Tax=Liquidambar formosana TaxID=63359 RepID=A0AAP0X568_LIQFO
MGDKPKPTSKADYTMKKKEFPSSETPLFHSIPITQHGLRPTCTRPPLSLSGKQSYPPHLFPTSLNPFAPLDFPKLPSSSNLSKGQTFAKVVASPLHLTSSPVVQNPSQFLEPSALPENVVPSQYIYNHNLLPIIAIEPEFRAVIPYQVFLLERHWLSPLGDKSQTYYEFILIDTDSALITHVPDKKNAAHFKCRILKLPWISKWDYVISPIGSHPSTPHLCRWFSFKWWDRANAQKAYVPNIILFFQKNPKYYKRPIQENSTSEFLAVKSKKQSKIASSKSKSEYKKYLLEALSQADSDEEHSDEASSSHPFNQNEDDCYGIEFFSQM